MGGKTTLNVTLKHKFSYAKFIIDARGLATHNNQDVTVSNVKLSGVHHNAGTINVNTGAFSGSGKSDIPITMTKKSAKLFESSYIPLSLNSGTTTGAFIADISAPAQHGTQKQAKRFPLNIKSGTKNTYTLKPNGNAFVPEPVYITHIKPLSLQVYTGTAGLDIKFAQGYNPAVWDPGKGFSVSKMRATNKWFPTTGFKGAEFDIIGSGNDQSKYRCIRAYGSWVTLSGGGNSNLGTNCHVTYDPVNKPTTHVIIEMEKQMNDGSWNKVDDYKINIPNKWTIISNNFHHYSEEYYDGEDDGGPPSASGDKASEYCYKVLGYKRNSLYNRNELTNSPNAGFNKTYFSRDADSTFTGEWGNLFFYKKSNWSLKGGDSNHAGIWTGEEESWSGSYKFMYVVSHTKGWIASSWVFDHHIASCRGE